MVFPEPLGPMNVKFSPSLIQNDTSLRTFFFPKFITTSLNSITVSTLPNLKDEEERCNDQSYEQEDYTQGNRESKVA